MKADLYRTTRYYDIWFARNFLPANFMIRLRVAATAEQGRGLGLKMENENSGIEIEKLYSSAGWYGPKYNNLKK
jgi:hypothetical protein